MAGNPYLTGGYEQFIRRPASASGRPEPPSTSYGQPLHPIVVSSRTPSAAVLTTAPPASMPSQPEAYFQQPAVSVSQGGSSVDIYVSPSTAVHAGTDSGSEYVPTSPRYGYANTASQPPQPTVEINISTQQERTHDATLVASHLEGLTVPQMLDLDIDSLAVKIDHHHCRTKKAVLDHFMETKARLMQAQNDALEEERRRGATRLAAKEEELNLMRAELAALKLKAQRLWDLLGRACAAYGQAKEHRRTTKLQFQLFYAWREQAMILARRKRLAEKAERFYVDVHLKRNVFRAWFRVAMREHRVTVNNRYIQEVENAKRLIHEHYQGQVSDLQRMLAEAHSQLEREAEARNRLEENMKRAFMRGVCALNIEAMNVMKRGSAPNGVNPFPINLPPVQADSAAAGGGSMQAASAGYSVQQQHQQVSSAAAMALSEAINLDLTGSITLSPTRLSAPAASSSSTAVHASSASGAAGTSITGAVRLSGTGLGGGGSNGGLAAYTGGVGAGSRPPSSSGGLGAGGNPLVVKAATGLPAPGLIPPAASGTEAAPVPRETAQSFYQRPQVTVTRGPAGASDAPRPRSGAPLPTVRMV